MSVQIDDLELLDAVRDFALAHPHHRRANLVQGFNAKLGR